MKILSGEANGAAGVKARELGLGVMISTVATNLAGPRHKLFKWAAMDNGAFGAWQGGNEFDGDLFRKNLDNAQRQELELLFVVCPDIVGGGLESLELSEEWRDQITGQPIALAVQDGMIAEDVAPIIENYDYLFIGGTVPWKWLHAKYWIDYGHSVGVPVHIGQCGGLDALIMASRLGADSVDSSSWSRRGTWWIIEAYQRDAQLELGFPEPRSRVPTREREFFK